MKSRLKLLLLCTCLLLLLAACNFALSGDAPPAGDTLAETRTPFQPDLSTATPTIHPTTTPPATYTSTPTDEPGCSETHGQIVASSMQPDGFASPLTFNLYLPPCYVENAPVNGYPLLILFHGQTYSEQQWIDIGLVDHMDSMVSSGEIQPYVIVMPYESTDYYNGLHNAVTDSLIPYLQANYDLCTGAECLAIGGISRGGGWALTAASKHPDMFRSLGLHSTPVSDGHLELLRYQVGAVGAQNFPRIAVDFGESDYWYSSEMDLVNALDQNGLAYDLSLNAGAHDNDYWSAHIAEYLRWYAAGWE